MQPSNRRKVLDLKNRDLSDTVVIFPFCNISKVIHTYLRFKGVTLLSSFKKVEKMKKKVDFLEHCSPKNENLTNSYVKIHFSRKHVFQIGVPVNNEFLI